MTIAPQTTGVHHLTLRSSDLARAYGTVVTIDRAHFKLRLFKRLKFSKSYGVAVGQPAYPTPTGRYQISNKQVNPAWTAPTSCSATAGSSGCYTTIRPSSRPQ